MSLIIIGGIIFYFAGRGNSANNQPDLTGQASTPTDNVKIENGQQIIEIQARGGFTPRQTVAKANIPTIIRMKTNNTFDCSSSLIIPTIGYRENLNPNGSTDVKLPVQKSGSLLRAFCAMGMYSFEIKFN